MRKLLVAVLALGLAVALKSTSFAYSTVGAPSTFSGGIQFTQAGSVSMTVSWQSGTSMTFTGNGGVTIGSTHWKAADNFLNLTTNMTDGTGGVQINTDNTGASAGAYKYTGSTSAASCAGLVNGTITTQVLPMCWRVIYTTGTVYGLQIVQGTDNSLYDAGFGGQNSKYPCYVWMLDRATPSTLNPDGSEKFPKFSDGVPYATVRSAVNGIQQAEATWLTLTAPTVRIYLGADFTNAVTALAGITYQTNTLTITAYKQ
jgi:hypothetical protein